MRIAYLAIGILMGCGSSTNIKKDRIKAPTTSNPITTPYGTVDFAQGTMPKVAFDQVLPYMKHWSYGTKFIIHIVPTSSLFLDGKEVGGVRLLGTGEIWLEEQASGLVEAYQWEIPLESQNVNDPSSFTWGLSGPLFSGQSQQGKDKTNELP